MADKQEKGTETIKDTEPTPTPEEQMEALKTQLAEATERATTAEATAEEKTQGFKSIQRQLSEKQKTIPQNSSAQAQATQEVINAMEAQLREAGDISPATQAKLTTARQHLASAEQQAQWERQDAVTTGVVNDLRNDFIEAGIDPDSAQCDAVWDAIRLAKIDDGNFDSAKSRATRVIKSVKPKEVKAELFFVSR